MKTCDCDKVAYPRKSDAQTAAAGIWDDDKIKMTPYKCPEGNGYHLATSKRKRIRDIPHGLSFIEYLTSKRKKRKKK